MTDDDPICPFGKYEGMGMSEIARIDPSYIYWIKTKVTNRPELVQWAEAWAETHSPEMYGNLTTRVKTLVRHSQKRRIMRECNIDGFCFTTSPLGLSNGLSVCLHYLKAHHDSGFGCFFDYLCRRIISLRVGVTPRDSRAEFVQGEMAATGELPLTDEPPFFCDPDYDVFQNRSVSTKDALKEVCMISERHLRCFNDSDKDKHEALVGAVTSLRDHVDELEALITSTMIPEDSHSVRLNPALGCYGIPADADLMVDTTIWDFKTGRDDDERDMLQLLGYAALAGVREQHVSRVAIFNPMSGIMKTCDISSWQSQEKIEFLCSLGGKRDETKEEKIAQEAIRVQREIAEKARLQREEERSKRLKRLAENRALEKKFGESKGGRCLSTVIVKGRKRQCKNMARHGSVCICHARHLAKN